MGEFFRSFKFKIIVCVLALLLGVLLYSLTKGGNATEGESLLGAVFNPVKRVSNSISAKVETTIDTLTNAQEYYEENEALRAQIGELNKRLVDYEDTKSELEELRKYVGIKEENEDFVLSQPCFIISRVTNDPYGSFLIERRENDGIAVNDPVITEAGLVGVIKEVAASYAVVTTLLSPDLSIGALCNESEDTGIVEGNLKYIQSGSTKMIYLKKEYTMKPGDLVITAGGSGLFPRGLVIGNVTEIGMEESGLSAYAVVHPAVELDRLNSVMVLLDFEGKGDQYDD